MSKIQTNNKMQVIGVLCNPPGVKFSSFYAKFHCGLNFLVRRVEFEKGGSKVDLVLGRITDTGVNINNTELEGAIAIRGGKNALITKQNIFYYEKLKLEECDTVREELNRLNK